MARDFTDILNAVWAANALTTIPNPPIPGQAYRNTEIDDSNLENGQQYSEVYDSARYNQLLYLLSGCLKMLMETGLPEWSAEQNYQPNAYTIGRDGKLYGPAKKASGPDNGGAVDPVTDAAGEATTWVLSLPDFEAPLAFDAAEGKVKLSVGNTTTVTADKLEVKVDPNGGLQGTTNGIVIKPVASGPVTVDANGINVSTFTAPTAGAPGKSGLVPQPQATDPAAQLANILTMQGWGSLSSAFVAKDPTSADSKKLCPALTFGEELNANALASGFFQSAKWTNAPSATSGTLLSIQMPFPQGYSVIQIFFSYTGHSSYRTTIGTVAYGQTPENATWQDWVTIGAPKPMAAEGVGQWARYGVPGGTNCTLPAEGVWAFHIIKRSLPSTGVSALYVGVAAGGTILDTQADSTVDYVGLVWQVSA